MNAPSEHRSLVQRVRTFFTEDVWRLGREGDVGPVRTGLYRVLRVGLIAGRGFVRDNCLMRAGSLTYVTIFSLVPLLAVSFAVAKGLGAGEKLQENFIEPFLDETFGGGDEESDDGELVVMGDVLDAVEEESSVPSAGEPVPGAPDTEETETGAPETGEPDELAAGTEDGATEDGEAGDGATEGGEAEGEEAGEALAATQEPAVEGTPPPAGQQLRTAIDQVFTFVRETNFGSIGTFGLIFLLWCVVKLLGATERTLSEIWGVRMSRSFTRRLTNYIAIVVITPLIIVTATGVPALIEGGYGLLAKLGIDIPQTQFTAALALLPFLIVSAGFTFLYIALPNTRVRMVSAILGGIIGGFLWQLGQLAHVEFQLGVARINAIYSGFAAVPLFLLWVYVNWSVLLLGAEIAHAHQSEPVQTSLALTGHVDQRFRERLAVRLAVRIADAFRRGLAPPNVHALATDLKLAPRHISEVIEMLLEGRVLVRTDEETDQGLVPARDPESIHVVHVLDALRSEPDVGEPPTVRKIDEGVDGVLSEFDRTLTESPQNKSLATLAKAFAEDELGDAGETRPVELPST